MRTSRDQQSLSYPLRLPDEAQLDALRLLDVSREVINVVITSLWDRLDEFGMRTNAYAYKQVEEMIEPPAAHGHRQWRCEAEQAGRILRGQAERKKQFALILPMLAQGMIQPKTEAKRAGKNRKAIKQALTDLREANSDGGNTVELQSLIEQACNFYFTNGCFPDTYEEMQAVPVLKAGILPYAGDDGPTMGQSYRLSLDLEQKQITLALRTTRYAVLDLIVEVPAAQAAAWEDMDTVLGFDWGVRTLVTASVVESSGHQVGRPFFLDTGPFDGRQARTRRQIDLLKKQVSVLETRCDGFPPGDPRGEPAVRKLGVLRREIARCWRKYEARNQDLAHLAANVLLTLAAASGCELIAGESLKSMKSTGRGRGAKGRWRNWRNNAQVRGELWRVLRYKCFLAGVRLEWQQPRHTSHTCPRCGKPANTYTSPEHRSKVNEWGAWLWCSTPDCGWNGSRDYAASLNIARLGATLIRHAQETSRVFHPSITHSSVKAVSYIGTVAALRLPPPAPRGRLIASGRIYCNGWCQSVKLRSSYSTSIMLRLCG